MLFKFYHDMNSRDFSLRHAVADAARDARAACRRVCRCVVATRGAAIRHAIFDDVSFSLRFDAAISFSPMLLRLDILPRGHACYATPCRHYAMLMPRATAPRYVAYADVTRYAAGFFAISLSFFQRRRFRYDAVFAAMLMMLLALLPDTPYAYFASFQMPPFRFSLEVLFDDFHFSPAFSSRHDE